MTDRPPIIVACASPPGRSPRALIRVSGDDLAALAEAICHPVPRDRAMQPTRIDLCGHESDQQAAPVGKRLAGHPCGGAPAPSRARLVPALSAFFQAPGSFTGEDVLELQVPGNPALVDRVLRQVIDVARAIGRSARLAEPGEFTRRAFTAGRIDLTRAEGVAATVAAQSDAELQAAALLRKGHLGQWSESLVDRLAQLLALVEAGIDFVDQEDVVAIAPVDLADRLAGIEAELSDMLDRSRSWSQLEALPWVVLVGPPNAGKSTLFNALLGRTRAVASGVAGTTRDVLTEPLSIERDGRKAELMLVDIGGLDEPAAALDEAVQRAARDAIARAELLLEIDDGSGVGRGEPARAAASRGTPRLKVRGKADRSTDPAADVNVSAVTGEGLEVLRAVLAERLADRAVTIGGGMLALQPRHRQAIEAALDSIREALSRVEPMREARDLAEPEIVAETMRQALDRLGEVGGRMTPDEVIGRVFSTFCIGK